MASNELNRYNMGFPQSQLNATPPTIASAEVIVPTHLFTFVTGTVSVETITPPEPGYHQVILCFTDNAPGIFDATDNIKTAYQPIQNRPIILHYDPLTTKYWVESDKA